MFQRQGIVLVFEVILMVFWNVKGESDLYDGPFLACSIKVSHQCKCGQNGRFQEVYVESCPDTMNEINFYDCLPCPDACYKFSNCLTCSKNQCQTCPPGKAGDFCEYMADEQSLHRENINISENLSSMPLEAPLEQNFDESSNSKTEGTDKDPSLSDQDFKILNYNEESVDNFISSLLSMENWFRQNTNITFVDFDNISSSDYSIEDLSLLSDITMLNDSISYEDEIPLDNFQLGSLLDENLEHHHLLHTANGKKDSIISPPENKNINISNDSEVFNLEANHTNSSKNISFSSESFKNNTDNILYNHSEFLMDRNDIVPETNEEETVKINNPTQKLKRPRITSRYVDPINFEFENPRGKKEDKTNLDSYQDQYSLKSFDAVPNEFLWPNEYHKKISPFLSQANGSKKLMNSKKIISPSSIVKNKSEKELNIQNDNMYRNTQINTLTDNNHSKASKESDPLSNTQKSVSMQDSSVNYSGDNLFIKAQNKNSDRDKYTEVLFLKIVPKYNIQNKMPDKDKLYRNTRDDALKQSGKHNNAQAEISMQNKIFSRKQNNKDKPSALFSPKTVPGDFIETSSRMFRPQNPKTNGYNLYSPLLPNFVPFDLTHCEMQPFDPVCLEIQNLNAQSYNKNFPRISYLQTEWKNDEFPNFRLNNQLKSIYLTDSLNRLQPNHQRRLNYYHRSLEDEYQHRPYNFHSYNNYALQRNYPLFPNQHNILHNEYPYVDYDYGYGSVLNGNNGNYLNYEEPFSNFYYKDRGVDNLKNRLNLKTGQYPDKYNLISRSNYNTKNNIKPSTISGRSTFKNHRYNTVLDKKINSRYSQYPDIESLKINEDIQNISRKTSKVQEEKYHPFARLTEVHQLKNNSKSKKIQNETILPDSNSAVFSVHAHIVPKENIQELSNPSEFKVFQNALPTEIYSKMVDLNFSLGNAALDSLDNKANKTGNVSLSMKGPTKRRKRRESDDSWCPIYRQSLHGNVECLMWTYKKICWIKCHEGYQANETSFVCIRDINQWLPPISPCFGKEENYDTEEDSQSVEEFYDDSEYKMEDNMLQNGIALQPGNDIETNDDQYELVYYTDYENN
ncbi:protein PFF0380w isoform X1 [Parasteatoda tepidariorum]|uniref:protein PFF0380w isoform X1 n=1 Tax=Parasteatoda tepidariorum TaxID=114398 RepID=UPI0039BC2EDC